MRLMTKITMHRQACIPVPITTWIGRCQRKLSDRVHAAGDDRAHNHGWDVTKTTGRSGFGARSYRDPRFDGLHRRLSAACDQPVSNLGVIAGPADDELGQTHGCARLAAAVAEWDAGWEAEP
jgi:hypothetical protein